MEKLGVVIAALALVASVVGNGLQYQQLQFEREKWEAERSELRADVQRYVQAYKDAPSTYAKLIEDKIKDALPIAERITTESNQEASAMDDKGRLVEKARALVVVRNNLRSDQRNIAEKLNSTITELETELARTPPSPKKVASLVKIINDTWPSRKVEIEIAVRRELTNYGLSPERPLK